MNKHSTGHRESATFRITAEAALERLALFQKLHISHATYTWPPKLVDLALNTGRPDMHLTALAELVSDLALQHAKADLTADELLTAAKSGSPTLTLPFLRGEALRYLRKMGSACPSFTALQDALSLLRCRYLELVPKFRPARKTNETWATLGFEAFQRNYLRSVQRTLTAESLMADQSLSLQEMDEKPLLTSLQLLPKVWDCDVAEIAVATLQTQLRKPEVWEIFYAAVYCGHSLREAAAMHGCAPSTASEQMSKPVLHALRCAFSPHGNERDSSLGFDFVAEILPSVLPHEDFLALVPKPEKTHSSRQNAEHRTIAR